MYVQVQNWSIVKFIRVAYLHFNHHFSLQQTKLIVRRIYRRIDQLSSSGPGPSGQSHLKGLKSHLTSLRNISNLSKKGPELML